MAGAAERVGNSAGSEARPRPGWPSLAVGDAAPAGKEIGCGLVAGRDVERGGNCCWVDAGGPAPGREVVRGGNLGLDGRETGGSGAGAGAGAVAGTDAGIGVGAGAGSGADAGDGERVCWIEGLEGAGKTAGS